MAYSYTGASQIKFARQFWPSGNERLPTQIVARTSNLALRPLRDYSINDRISVRQLNLLATPAVGVKKKEIMNKIFAKGETEKPISDNAPQIKYDVFVNFRGEDIRSGFLGHLSEAFSRKQVYAFIDDKLQKGESVMPSLFRAIEGSSISLVIFSAHYASSRWCLEELVKILKCKKKNKQIVIPVFYNVDPTVVRNQKRWYAISLAFHIIKYPCKVNIWKNALKDSADIGGITSSNFRNEVEMVEEIVSQVLKKLREIHVNVNSKALVGINKPIAHIESLLSQESKDVRLIGVWGTGGIGKTTIAEEVLNRQCSKYDGCYFLEIVGEDSRRPQIISLKEKVFSTLLGEDVRINTPSGLSNYIERRMSRQKVLIILDDVNMNDSDQIEKIFGGARDWLGSGSRIIITTRDKKVLDANKVDDIYDVEVLSNDDALELFNLIAFDQNHLKMEYQELSKRVVDYAKGIPLILIVLGRFLCKKLDKEVWESELYKLKKMPRKEVHDIMKLSYDGLDRKEKDIFLDLACFFSGLNLTVDYIKSLLEDHENDNSVAVVLERLKDKALITISKDNCVSMHDIIKQMAWEIVRQESNDLGSRRLGDPGEIYEVLKNDKQGTEDIRGIKAHLPAIMKPILSPNIFAKMTKLHFLDFHYEVGLEFGDLFPQGLQSLPTELRYLRWTSYPFKSLPDQFSTEKLVILDLSYSRVEKLWSGVKNLVNLKEVTLDSCPLKELPDFSKATNLKVLDLNWCQQLTSVHPSIFSLNMLQKLNLFDCTSLTKLSSDIHLSSLRYLNLSCCKKLEEFSVTSENMIELNISSTRVNALPISFGRQKKLEFLKLAFSYIESLPSSIKNLTSLQYLNISCCKKLQILPELPPSVETLLVDNCTSLKTVLFPSTATKQFSESRTRVDFWNCLDLDEHSLMAIEFNAQINLMKFAHQHISAPKQEHVQNFGDDNYHSYQAMYLYPGSNVPEWLVYKTTGDYVIIDLASASPSPLWGFIFCFVLGKDEQQFWGRELQFNIAISHDEDEGNKDPVHIYMSTSFWVIKADHVCLIYDQRCSCSLNSCIKNILKFKIKATAWFTSSLKGSNPQRVMLEGFGVSLINTSTYHKLIQEMSPNVFG